MPLTGDVYNSAKVGDDQLTKNHITISPSFHFVSSPRTTLRKNNISNKFEYHAIIAIAWYLLTLTIDVLTL